MMNQTVRVTPMSTIDLNKKEYVIEVSPYGWTVRFISEDMNTNIYDFVSLQDATDLANRLSHTGYTDFHKRVE